MKSIKVVLYATLLFVLTACTISYKFNGAFIDYTKTRSIGIADFNNLAELVHPPLANNFSEKLRDAYSRQTRLQILKQGGDLEVEGEITGYSLAPMAVGADNYASETKVTLTIRVRFTNNAVPEEGFDKSYTASQIFDSTRLLTDVQDELLEIMTTEIVESIYNDTVARW